MLISCPSCDKDYRVPSSAIPPEGREVRCSGCGAVWFEVGQRVQMLAAAAASADVLPYPVIETRYSAPPRRHPASPAGGARAQQAALAVVYPAPEKESPPAADEGAEDLWAQAAAGLSTVFHAFRRSVSRLRERLTLRGTAKAAPRPSAAPAATAAARGRLRANVANRLTPLRAAGWVLWLGAVGGTAYALTAEREAVTTYFPPAAKLYDRLPGAAPAPGLSVRAEVSRYAQSIQGPGVVVTGIVANDGEEAVPRVLLTAQTPAGAETQALPLPGVPLPRGGERPFAVRALLPEGTTRIVVKVERGQPAAKAVPLAEAGPMGFAGPPPLRDSR